MDIRAKVITALRWTTVARFAGQLLSWAITILVIRMLSPQDYGLMTMAMVVITFFVLLNTAGLDAVLVQRRSLREEVRSQVFGLVILINLVLCGGLLVTAPFIADIYGEPRLTDIVRVLAAQFVLLIFETLPQSKLEKDLDFKDRSIVDLMTILAGSLVTLVLAYNSLGVWALVWGVMATTATRMLGLNLISRQLCRPSFSFKGIREHLAFGGSVTTDRVLHFIFSETDKFIGGKLLGKEMLGYYAIASHLASLPIQKLAALINSVAFPAFSHAQTDRRKTSAYLLKASRVLSILVFPVFFGISSVAPELTALLLGPKWQVAALPLQILSLVMPLRMVMNLFQPLLWGIGRPDVSVRIFMLASVVMPVAFFVGASWGGLIGISLAWLVAYPVVFFIAVWRAVPLVGVTRGEFLRTLVPPTIASAVMYAAVLVVKGYAVGQAGEFWNFTQLVLVGGLAYVAMLLLLDRKGLQETLELVRR